MDKMHLNPYYTLYKKINFRWIVRLNVKDKMINPFEENIGEWFHDLRVGKDFLNTTGKVLIIKELIYKRKPIKIKNFYLSNIYFKIKGKPQSGERYL